LPQLASSSEYCLPVYAVTRQKYHCHIPASRLAVRPVETAQYFILRSLFVHQQLNRHLILEFRQKSLKKKQRLA